MSAATGEHAPIRTLRVATRRSALAIAQSRMIGDQLAALTGRTLELVEVTTQGDVDRGPLTQIGGSGVFVAAVRAAVIQGSADVAVHSLKDLPTKAEPRLALAAIPRRADSADVLVAAPGESLATLRPGARVGTGSPRRRSQLAAARPDLQLVDIRGNVDTRIRRVRRAAATAAPGAHAPDEPEPERGALDPQTALQEPAAGTGRSLPDLDAVVLAAAGLDRLGRSADVSERLDPETLLPAPGQGALAVEVRAGVLTAPPHDITSPDSASPDSAPRDPAAPSDSGAPDPVLAAALRSIDDPPTRAQVTAERALLATLEAGCSAPLGALARTSGAEGHHLHLSAVLARPDGSLLRASISGRTSDAHALGAELAARMLADGELASASDLESSTADDLTVTGPAHRGSTT